MSERTGLLDGLRGLLQRPVRPRVRVRFGLMLAGVAWVSGAGVQCAGGGANDDGPVATARRVAALSTAIDRGGVLVSGDLRAPRQPVSVQDQIGRAHV